MFKKFSILVTALCLTSGAHAATASKYSCDNVGGTAEWTIYVDLKKKIAGFFDNDSTVVVPLKKVGMLESLPPQMVYVFEGREPNGDKLRISFNKTKLKGSVTLNVGKRSQSTLQSQNGCEADKSVDIDLE
jgi:hypothetical protein